MLQSHELKLHPNNENYTHDAMHEYAQNVHCDVWNENRLKLLPGKEFTNIAADSKKDDCTELANVTMSTNSHETGNLLTLPSFVLLYVFSIRAGFICLQISYCKSLIDVASTSLVVWSQ